MNINGFHGHPKILLTYILASSDEHTRQDAVSKVLAIRRRDEEKIVASKKKEASKKNEASKKKEESKKKAKKNQKAAGTRTEFQSCKNQ